MTKPKSLVTFAGAVSRVIALLGREHAAYVVGKTPGLVYKWEDEDGISRPNFVQAMQLDAEAVRMTGRAPLLEYYSGVMELIASEAPKSKEKLETAVLNAAHSIGQIAQMAASYSDEHSHGGCTLTQREITALRGEINQLILKLRQLDRSLSDQMKPRGVA